MGKGNKRSLNVDQNLSFGKKLTNSYQKDYFRRLKMLCLSMYEWKNLPPNVSGRYIEDILFTYGFIPFFEQDKYGFMCIQGTVSRIDFYGEPSEMKVFASSTGETLYENLTSEEFILIRNNPCSTPTYPVIANYAYDLGIVREIATVNIKAQRTPVLLDVDEKTRLSVLNAYKQVEEGQPVIVANKKLGESISVIKTDAPYIADKLTDYRHDLFNEALSSIGINNANTDKRERLIASEAQSNNQEVRLMLKLGLSERQESARRINERWGLHISVEPREDIQEILDNTLKKEDDNIE